MLYDACLPMHFETSSKDTLDEPYRIGRDMPAERFALNFDPLDYRGGVLEAISKTMLCPAVAVRGELNAYTAGMFYCLLLCTIYKALFFCL